MNCPKQIVFIRRLGHELGPEDARRLDEHVRECDRCAERFREFERVWDLAGEWQVNSPPVDLTRRVLSAIQEDAGPSVRRPRHSMSRSLRAAASLAAAAGLGIAAGLVDLSSVTDGESRDAAGDTFLTQEPEDQVLLAIGLEGWGMESATGIPLELDALDPQVSEDSP